MTYTPKKAPSDAALRRRRKRQIRREAERRVAEMKVTPTLREIYAPKVIFGLIFVLAIIGGLLVNKVSRTVKEDPDRPIPHLVAIRSLDNLATALGRYKMHVGEYPTTKQGILALNLDPGVKGWNGPYLVALNTDPWGRDYIYERGTNTIPRLFTRGPDGEIGTRDDLYPGVESFDPGTDWTNGWLRKEDRLPSIQLDPEK